MLEGRFPFWCNGARVELDSGGVIAVPRGPVHRFENVGSALGRLMVVTTPGVFEGFFRTFEKEGPQNLQKIYALAARFDMSFVPALSAAAARHVAGAAAFVAAAPATTP